MTSRIPRLHLISLQTTGITHFVACQLVPRWRGKAPMACKDTQRVIPKIRWYGEISAILTRNSHSLRPRLPTSELNYGHRRSLFGCKVSPTFLVQESPRVMTILFDETNERFRTCCFSASFLFANNSIIFDTFYCCAFKTAAFGSQLLLRPMDSCHPQRHSFLPSILFSLIPSLHIPEYRYICMRSEERISKIDSTCFIFRSIIFVVQRTISSSPTSTSWSDHTERPSDDNDKHHLVAQGCLPWHLLVICGTDF